MIVLGADTHKRSHTIAGVGAATGESVGERTVQVGRAGFGGLLSWARELGDERVWALEDCRHVSGSVERFLIERGERVLRIPTNLMTRDAQELPRARQVGRHRRGQRRAGRAARGPRRVSGRPLGWARARSAVAGRSSRAHGQSSRRAQQHAAVASARSLARARAAGRRVVLKEVGHPDRVAVGPRRADAARPDRARRAAPPVRAERHDQGARPRDHPARRADRAASARRARVRPLIAAKLIGEIAGAQRFATAAKVAARPASRPSLPARATPAASAWTAAATADQVADPDKLGHPRSVPAPQQPQPLAATLDTGPSSDKQLRAAQPAARCRSGPERQSSARRPTARRR